MEIARPQFPEEYARCGLQSVGRIWGVRKLPLRRLDSVGEVRTVYPQVIGIVKMERLEMGNKIAAAVGGQRSMGFRHRCDTDDCARYVDHTLPHS
jgi:hypothetical protein